MNGYIEIIKECKKLGWKPVKRMYKLNYYLLSLNISYEGKKCVVEY